MTTTHKLTVNTSRHDYTDGQTNIECREALALLKRSTRGDYHIRFGVVATLEGGASRRVTEGPLVPGPHAATFGLCSVIDNHGGTGRDIDEAKTAGLWVEVAEGDVLDIEGTLYRIRIVRREYLALDRIDSEGNVTLKSCVW